MEKTYEISPEEAAEIAVITNERELYMWGSNGYGQLGNGSYEECSEPPKIMDDVVKVEVARWSTAAITSDGSLYVWGNNVGLGNSESTNTPVKVMDNVVSVDLATSYFSVVTEDGIVYIWGDDSHRMDTYQRNPGFVTLTNANKIYAKNLEE